MIGKMGKQISLGLLLLIVVALIPGVQAQTSYYGVLQSLYGGPKSCQYDCHPYSSPPPYTAYGTLFAKQPNHGDVIGGGTLAALIAIGPPVTTITTNPPTASLTAGGNQIFTAAALDPFGNSLTIALRWTSSNITVGKIDPSGKFTALAAGTTVITAANGSVSGTSTAIVAENTQTAPSYNLTVLVVDNATGSPISGASVVVDSIKQITDATGSSAFMNISAGAHKYTVSGKGYKRITGTVAVNGDQTLIIKLAHR